MILLLSSSSDANIDFVVSWLKFYKHKYIRLNADEIIEGDFTLSLSEKYMMLNGKKIDPDTINAVWYRKFGGFSRTGYYKKVKDKISPQDLQQLASEYSAILSSIISLLKDKKWLTQPWLSSVNKLDMISLATECNIKTPKTWIISSKKRMKELMDEGYDLISKSVYEPYFIKSENGFYSMFTKQISNRGKIPKTFFPSLVQVKIPKKYELRIFYIDGEFYTMAIFSQSNKVTEMDFRKFDATKPTKRIPYKLPNLLKKRLTYMMKQFGLNCCSIDLIKSSIDDEYYFLEVNPTGEFGMVSIPCNYTIYKKIAQTLIQFDN